MRLNDPLVNTCEYEGARYSLDLSFDNVLNVFDVFDDADLREYEQADIALALLVGVEYKSNTNDLWNYIYATYINVESKRSIEYDRKGNPLPFQKESKQSIDFNKDAEYIYASFMQAYKINLYHERGKLHWHEFKSLLSGLPSDTIMQRIIQIRLYEPSKGESSEYKQAMRDLQKIYALEEIEEE
ncbi:Gp15 family bacteriophage protein [Sporosarcina sp. FSL K6-1540]|uniref:Gp15 family bacteriophage protein n=1 Tax=Sporosarcina sp. FSL K6-1540 TaxID=2921555 RepID=UPI00315A7B8F